MPFNTFESIMTKVDTCSHGVDCDLCCWPWKGSCDTKGYGKVMWLGHHWVAHKLIFIMYKQIPLFRKFYACHTCDNSICCNWNHVYEGTARSNARDKVERNKGNSAFGNKFPQSKLNEGKVRQMRRLYASGGIFDVARYRKGRSNKGVNSWSIKDIAELFSVSVSVTQRILRHEDWKHVK